MPYRRAEERATFFFGDRDKLLGLRGCRSVVAGDDMERCDAGQGVHQRADLTQLSRRLDVIPFPAPESSPRVPTLEARTSPCC